MRFAVDLLDHGPFRYGFDTVAARVAELGARVALAQTLLKLTVPGLPDIYQGDELWALSLVDPDNRRPVDWDARREALAALRDGAPPTADTIKLHLVAAALDLRRRRPERVRHQQLHAGARRRRHRRLPARHRRPGRRRHPRRRHRRRRLGAAAAAAGRWRDVLTAEEYDLPDGATLAGILGPTGRALLERIA